MMRSIEWSGEQVKALTDLWLAGKSCSQIANALGVQFHTVRVTRNAVIGKVHRLGLSSCARPKGSVRPTRAALAARPPKPAKETRFPALAKDPIRLPVKAATAKPKPVEAKEAPSDLARVFDLPETGGVPIWNLEVDHCRWPLGDPMDPDSFRFCGAEKGENSYCAHHHRLAFQPSVKKRDFRSTPTPKFRTNERPVKAYTVD